MEGITGAMSLLRCSTKPCALVAGSSGAEWRREDEPGGLIDAFAKV